MNSFAQPEAFGHFDETTQLLSSHVSEALALAVSTHRQLDPKSKDFGLLVSQLKCSSFELFFAPLVSV